MTLTQNKFHLCSCKTKAHLYCPSKRHKKKANPYFLEDAYAQPIFDS